MLQIGQLARLTGLSAKALRLYEERGLLKPCAHSAAGYRLYGEVALRRLMQITVLRRSGFSLAQISALLKSGGNDAADILAARVEALERDVRDKLQALATLRRVMAEIGSTPSSNIPQLLESLSMSKQIDLSTSATQRAALLARAKAFAVLQAPGQQAQFQARVEQRIADLGADGLDALQRPWRELSADIRAAMQSGVSPRDPALAGLTQRWRTHVDALIARDPEFITKLRTAYERHPELMTEQSMSPALIDFMTEALAAINPGE